jgi:hypothetical protein
VPRSSGICAAHRAVPRCDRCAADATLRGRARRTTCQGRFAVSSTKMFSQVGSASTCLPRFIHRLPAAAGSTGERSRNPLVLRRFRATATLASRHGPCSARTPRYSATSPQGRGSSRWILAGPNGRSPLCSRESAPRQSPRPHRDASRASVEAHPLLHLTPEPVRGARIGQRLKIRCRLGRSLHARTTVLGNRRSERVVPCPSVPFQ